MQDRILKTGNGQFKSAQWTGKNESLIEPVCDKIVVLPDEALEKTTGGIIIPDDQKGRQSVAALSGLLVAVGPQAFAYDSNRLVRWEGWRPKPGDRIVFSRFSGEEYPGADGRTYRVMQDTCVGGVVERAVEAATDGLDYDRRRKLLASGRISTQEQVDLHFTAAELLPFGPWVLNASGTHWESQRHAA